MSIRKAKKLPGQIGQENMLDIPRMDLAIIIPFLEKYGGAERLLIECLSRWQDRHDITLYSTKINERLLEEHGVKDIVKRTLLSSYFEGEHSMLLNALLLPKMWQEEIGHHELYHTHLWPTHLVDLHPMVWYPHEALRILHDLRFDQNVENVGQDASRNIHIYPKYNYDRIGDSVYEAYLSSIDTMDKAVRPERIVANSRYSAKYLESVYNTSVADVVYPGVEPEAFIELPTDPNLFVTIGQLWPHKRINLLIEAIALTDDTQLIVIGAGPEKENLQAMTRKLGVEDRVFFLSGLTNWELSLVLARACAFLFAAIKEPFGIVVLEAMAAGKPIIAVDQGGYVEACQPDYSFLIPPFPSAFAEKITYLQRHPEIAERMGEAGRQIAPRFTWEKTASELESLLIDTWQEEQSSKAHRQATLQDGQTLVGIQYYLWYGEGFGASHWNDDPRHGYVADKPLLGYYASTKGQIIEFHFDLFEQMGLDYVALNLHVDITGVNGLELMGIQHVFDIAKKRNSQLRFAIQLAPYAESTKELEKVIQLVQKLYVDHPNYFYLDDKPVLFWFWSTAFDGNQKLFSSLSAMTAEFANLAMSLRLPQKDNESNLTFDFFKGFAPFSPLELADKSNWEKVWNAAYQASKRAGMTYRIATISPGYNDQALDDERRTGNPYRNIDRDNGQTYRRAIEFIRTLKLPPHLVMVSTFNEFHENTHIEPSIMHGTQYIDMTAEFVKDIKGESINGEN
ncbi:MAG: glycosyltransferase [Cyanobacteria bacterium P01_D01_bin.156]